jgi:hypothetical protein
VIDHPSSPVVHGGQDQECRLDRFIIPHHPADDFEKPKCPGDPRHDVEIVNPV